MKNLFKIIAVSYCFTFTCLAQQEKPKRFKLFPKDMTNLKGFYNSHLVYFEVKQGERIASVGAGDGSQEMQLAIFNEDIDWTLNDIDSTSLNPVEFKRVLNYFENVTQKPIKAKFSLVMGEEKKTNLAENTFDRILVNNVYHELFDKQAIMTDIHRALKEKGRVIMMENVADKVGERHQGCNHLKPMELDLLNEMEKFNFKLVKKNRPKKKISQTFFTFEKIGRE